MAWLQLPPKPAAGRPAQMVLVGQKAVVNGANFGIARAAAWPASDDLGCVFGTTLFVDGGMTDYAGFATGG